MVNRTSNALTPKINLFIYRSNTLIKIRVQNHSNIMKIYLWMASNNIFANKQTVTASLRVQSFVRLKKYLHLGCGMIILKFFVYKKPFYSRINFRVLSDKQKI